MGKATSKTKAPKGAKVAQPAKAGAAVRKGGNSVKGSKLSQPGRKGPTARRPQT